MLYGFPGAGKTHFARQLSDVVTAAHLQSDKIRHELFESPRYDDNENNIIDHLMRYMAEEFLNSGVSVIYDMNAAKLGHRRALRDLARKAHAESILVWLQIDSDSAMTRLKARDRRKSDDKYATDYTKKTFESHTGSMQNPGAEDYIVISGKHTFNTQKGAVMKKLYDMGIVESSSATTSVIKPGLVNLIPNAAGGRVDMSRRNIIIR